MDDSYIDNLTEDRTRVGFTRGLLTLEIPEQDAIEPSHDEIWLEPPLEFFNARYNAWRRRSSSPLR